MSRWAATTFAILQAALEEDPSGFTWRSNPTIEYSDTGYQAGLGPPLLFEERIRPAQFLAPSTDLQERLMDFLDSVKSAVVEADVDGRGIGGWAARSGFFDLEVSQWLATEPELHDFLSMHPEQIEYFDHAAQKSFPRPAGL